MQRPRILFLSSCTPSPTGTGWEQRAFRFVSAYASFMEVSCWMGVTGLEISREKAKEVLELCTNVKFLTRNDVYAAPWDHNLARRLLSSKPLLATMPFRKEFLKDLVQAASCCDLVHFCRFSRYLRPLIGSHAKKTVCDLDEVPWNARQPRQNHEMPAKGHGNIFYRVAKKWDLIRDQRFFARELGHFSSVYVCSKLEEDELQTNTRVCVALNTVEEPQAESSGDCSPSTNRHILFVGNLNYAPNQDALRFFADDVWPEIQRDCPECKFTIVGRALRSEWDERTGFEKFLLRVLEQRNFELRTDVPDVTPFYYQSAVCVAPIRYGGGTRVKIIEAFAHKRPVVSTTVGCEGLNVVNDKHLLIADDPKSFAKKCVRLLNDAPLRWRLSRAAYDYFLKNHTPAAFHTAVFNELRRLEIVS